MEGINPHGKRILFGKYGPKDGKEGELFTRLPVGYLRWMINEGTKQANIAKAEFERRGDTMPKIELSRHAIDNASIRVWKIFRSQSRKGEGICSWLERETLDAIENGIRHGDKIHHKGMRFVIAEGEEFPTLKTVMRIKGAKQNESTR